MNINRRKTGILVAIIITILICMSACFAYAETIEEYRMQIENNKNRIQLADTIKTQLHITAELIREDEETNNGFDTLLSEKWHQYNSLQTDLLSENEELSKKIIELQNQKKFVGNFKITHYCPCTTCNGSWGSKTALGTTMTPYRTIAVDPRVIPLGSKVEINGKIYIAEDTGGAIKGYRIDMCVSSHGEAYQKGVLNNVPVYIVS